MQRHSMTTRLLALMLCLTISAPALGQREYRFAFLKLPDLGRDFTTGRAINELGHAVGASFVPGGGYHATLWIDGSVVDLGVLSGDSEAWDVSDDGRVVGRSGGISTRRAFLWLDGRMEDLGTLGGDTAEAQAINEAGQIVGFSTLLPGQPQGRAFVWDNGVMTALEGFSPETSSGAQAINSSGLVVGNGPHPDYGNEQRAALWQDGKIMDLGTFRPNNTGESRAFGINDHGYVVGYADTDSGFGHIAFIWFDGRLYNIGRPIGSTRSIAYDINNLGQVVGVASHEITGDFIAFFWAPGIGNQRLDAMTPPRLRGIGGLKFAEGINDAGQIAGTAYPPDDPIGSIAFIMSPVNPTMELAAPSPGRAGEMNTLTVAGCTPGATVQFLYSRFGGGASIPGCDLQQNALQLDSPTVIGTAVADANGVATITRTAPPIARNQTILFQAVVQNECAISQLVAHRFE